MDDEITHSSKESVYMDFIKISMPFHPSYNSIMASDHIYLQIHITDVSTVTF